ncbi:MAG TPA: M28 family peptidase [Candidatus Eisenbacteria bacterium]|nr:M28 family peptidase [Candidatus Eisenbacteria bacterium]
MPSTASSGSSRPILSARARPALAAGLLLLALGSCSRPAAATAFDGKRAFSVLERQCAFGPRYPGSEAHDSCFAYLVSALRAYAPVVECDTFYYDSPVLKKRVQLMNVVARFRPGVKQRVLIGAHWDTRPWADRDPVLAKRHLPILGANDGASGVAVVVELARALRMGHEQPSVGVDLALFDGEDLGTDADPTGYFRGSQRYVEWKSEETPPLFAVIIDMVGSSTMVLHWEGNSRKMASNIVDLVWGEANSLGVRSFRSDVKHTVYDDHIPFLNAGIPAIDLIDFDYPSWHTTHDTVDKCSAESLGGVGKVLLSVVTKPNLLAN